MVNHVAPEREPEMASADTDASSTPVPLGSPHTGLRGLRAAFAAVGRYHRGVIARAWNDSWRAAHRQGLAAGLVVAVLTALAEAYGERSVHVWHLIAAALAGFVGAMLLFFLVNLLVVTPARMAQETDRLRAKAEAETRRAIGSSSQEGDAVAEIEREIGAGEQILAKAEDPAWKDFQRDHAINEWVPRAHGVIRDLAPRYYDWFPDLGPQISEALRPGATDMTNLDRSRLQIKARLARLRDIRDRLLAQRPEGHPDGLRQTNMSLFADVLMDARLAGNRLTREGRLQPLREWETNLRRLAEQSLTDAEVDHLFENGFRSDNWMLVGELDKNAVTHYAERSLRLGELVHRVPELTLKPGFDPKGWVNVF